jgi:hypothetical protein
MSKSRQIKTSIKAIVKYWEEQDLNDQTENIKDRLWDECNLNFDWSDAEICCWNCGEKLRLQRCHIIPHSLGGVDKPSNYVLLCNECHREAPNVNSSDAMWDWIRSNKLQGVEQLIGYRMAQALKLFQIRSGKSYTDTINDFIKEKNISNDAVNKLTEFIKQSGTAFFDNYCSTHWGDGFNIETRYFFLKKTCDVVKEKLTEFNIEE